MTENRDAREATGDGRQYCPECGESVLRRDRFCIYCSADLSEERHAVDTDTGRTPDEAGPPTGGVQKDSRRTVMGHLRLIVACLGLTVGSIVLGTAVALVILVGLFLIGAEPSSTDELVVSLVAVQGIAFPGVSWAYFRYKGRSLRAFVPVSVPDRREVAVILGAWIGCLVLVSVAAAVVVSLAGTEPASNEGSRTAAENPEFIPFLIPLVFLLNAPGEELLFRGVIQGLFRERFGPVGAILLATAMFAPIHIFALVGGVQAALVTITILSIPSIVFGATYEYTGNFIVPTLVHAIYNTTLFGLLYLSSTMGETAGLLTDLAALQ